jgi:hypothetical protein
MRLYAKRKVGFHNMRPERARRGTRTLVELADDYAHTYAPFIQAAVREVENLVVPYWRLTGRRILIPYKRFRTPAALRTRI